jgi:hypothetical protein
LPDGLPSSILITQLPTIAKMIDIKQIRNDPEKFRKAAKDKNFDVDIDRLLEVDSQLMAARKQLQDHFVFA